MSAISFIPPFFLPLNSYPPFPSPLTTFPKTFINSSFSLPFSTNSLLRNLLYSPLSLSFTPIPSPSLNLPLRTGDMTTFHDPCLPSPPPSLPLLSPPRLSADGSLLADIGSYVPTV